MKGPSKLNVMMSCHQSRLHSGFDRLPQPIIRERLVKKEEQGVRRPSSFHVFDHRCTVHISKFQMHKVRNCRDAPTQSGWQHAEIGNRASQ